MEFHFLAGFLGPAFIINSEPQKIGRLSREVARNWVRDSTSKFLAGLPNFKEEGNPEIGRKRPGKIGKRLGGKKRGSEIWDKLWAGG